MLKQSLKDDTVAAAGRAQLTSVVTN